MIDSTCTHTQKSLTSVPDYHFELNNLYKFRAKQQTAVFLRPQ